MEFKDKLKQLRTEKGISQQALADAIHFSRSAVAKWENGLGYPSQDSIEVLTAYFGVEENYFCTEEPETVIVSKNRHIQMLKRALWAVVAAVAIGVAVLGYGWATSVDEQDTQGLAKQAAEYLGCDEVEIAKYTRRGNYLAALCKVQENNWGMCVFERSAIFGSRWVAGGGTWALEDGKIGSWNYGSPQGEAVLIFFGAELPEQVFWYSFENAGIEYTCPVTDETVLDIFIIQDNDNINGSPIPLNEEKKPIA